ncbi:MAG TPA: phosphoribosylamine--glycine ligase [Firmicutes bacterium]|nr:phosphoribosylamine--glycine ligase [Bacillota bacterium]
MRVLVVGSGGREHAIVWAVSRNRDVDKIYAAPGNAGMSGLAECIPIEATDLETLADFARANRVDLTIVGPEAPLALGITDVFAARGLKIFGPGRASAQIESSKVFAKEFMKRHSIPTAQFSAFDSLEESLAFVRKRDGALVIKADGLAAGKGVVIAQNSREAEKALRSMMEDRSLGDAGAKVVIEELLEGPEVSVMALCDGETILPLAPAQDHKRAFDGDRGPNTGGMGAYSPVPVLDPPMMERVYSEILVPTLEGLREEGIPYKGVLYAGLILTGDGPMVLEFNCRLGDPETQAVLPRLDGDLVSLAQACVEGRLSEVALHWKNEACVCVVAASAGYPGRYEKGKSISGLDRIKEHEDVLVFHAGTAFRDAGSGRKEIVTSGGRVLGVAALGKDIETARCRAYQAIKEISFEGIFWRSDIASKR